MWNADIQIRNIDNSLILLCRGHVFFDSAVSPSTAFTPYFYEDELIEKDYDPEKKAECESQSLIVGTSRFIKVHLLFFFPFWIHVLKKTSISNN